MGQRKTFTLEFKHGVVQLLEGGSCPASRIAHEFGIKRNQRSKWQTDTFSQFVEWVPVCPEFEAGLGIPREAMRLVGIPEAPKLITIKTKKDHTSLLNNYARKKVQELASVDLDGFVFKKDSPSCGVHRVRLYNDQGMPNRMGRGLFAQRFVELLLFRLKRKDD